MLTRDRLKKRILQWWTDSSLPAITDSQIQALADLLEDEVVEIAREAHHRGLKGKVF